MEAIGVVGVVGVDGVDGVGGVGGVYTDIFIHKDSKIQIKVSVIGLFK